ncbi:family 43 glycosylhydrolase [Microbacterium allomyrinae]|uniref:Family 43 glycosylhydrolase n=1 Tax=Microbacterium allomyrinae TaxID=2830666 RepID=A0A9X1LT39_9MICO|nr:family 43 glycosylhydrolase [Microbacterium allomyrinae]MCC2031480.1 family 43 glycosylhydrolase [Microbacterium allomyrinae]
MVWKPSTLRSGIAAAAVGILLASLAQAPAMAATENPIIGDGSVYSADPSLLADGETLYIHAGRDEAGTTTNDFIMNEWQAFSTTDADGGAWQHHPSLMRPETVFDWATPGRAYAGQVVKGIDGRFYWYVPVNEAASTAPDKFGIGVAVSDTPLGPWTDHAGGPIVSQTILGNDAHNIDPTVLVDDGRVWMYWGSFGRLMATELQTDMKTRIGSPTSVSGGVTGFFEAAWLFERNDTYYLAYAANNAGPTSTCTPANYHACIAYSTATSPLGPWTYRGRILAPVSSTTSHPAIAEFQGEWYMAYHTADAVGGNHFRRSVAIDKVEWDDAQTPARILPVVTTPERSVDLTPRSNVAPWATASASNEPIPTQYWIRSLNDELIRPNPLPPDMWGSWTGTRPAQQWIQYDWDAPVRVDRARIKFWRDAAPGTGNGVSDPSSWVLQFWDAGEWKDVPNPSGYPTTTTAVHQVTFGAVTTSRLRAVLNAAPNSATPPQYSALAVEEWEVHAAQPDSVEPVAVQTVVGTPPELPETVSLQYGADAVAAPVRWDAVDPADLAAAGEFTVGGFVEGYAAGRVTATVAVLGQSPWRTNLAPTGAPAAEATAGGSTVDALNDTVIAYTGAEHPVWTTAGGDAAARWAGYTWAEPVRVDGVTAHFWSDGSGPDAGDGVAVAQAWSVQVLVDDEWRDVTGADGYPTDSGTPNAATFDPVTTTGIRVVLTAQSDGDGHAGVGLGELEVFGETLDAAAPEVSLAATGVEGANGWHLSTVTVRATATDDRDVRTRIELAVDGGAWQVAENVRSADATVSGDGQHTVKARATDAGGNTSEEASLAVRIDATRPSVTGTLDIASRTVSATAADAGSGVAGIEYAIDAPTGWQAYSAAFGVDDQRHVVYLRSKDAAGNVSALSTVTVPLSPDAPLEGNIAPIATPTASYTSGWNSVTAVNDGALTGASWGTWPNIGEQWVQLEWDRVVTIDRAGVLFFRDSTDASNAGMIPPREWKLQYMNLADGQWLDVAAAGAYGRSSTAINEVGFAAVTTTKLRAVMQAWGAASGGGSSGILEFEAWAAEAAAPTLDVDVTVAGRCVAGKATLVVVAANGSDVPVTVVLQSPYGAKTVADLAPGKRSSQAFSTRQATVPPGEVGAVVTGVVDGQTVTQEDSVEYDALTC